MPASIIPRITDTRRLRWHKLAVSLQAVGTATHPAALNDSVLVSMRKCAEALGCTLSLNDTESVLLKRMLQKANTIGFQIGSSRGAPVFPFNSSSAFNNEDTLDAAEHKLTALVNTITALSGGTTPSGSGINWAFNNPLAVMERKLVKCLNGTGGQPGYPLPSGAVVWYKLENNITDSLGNVALAVNGTENYGAGEVGQAFSFDGGTVLTNGPTASSPVDVSPATIELWVKPTSPYGVSANGSGYAHLVANSDGGWLLGLHDDGAIETGFAWGHGGSVSAPNSFPLDGNWHHLALTVDNGTSTYTVFVDAVQKGQFTIDTSFFWGGTFTIGAASFDQAGDIDTNSYFLGLLDEVTVYSRVLTQTEISGIYNAGSYGKV